MRALLAILCAVVISACTGPGTPKASKPQPADAPKTGLSISGEARIGIVKGG